MSVANNNNIQKFGTYYKLRHIPSGLFYVPSSFRTYTNLSKFGKLYPSIPLDLREGKYSHFYDENLTKRLIFLEDWEIVTVLIQEDEILNYKYELEKVHTNNLNKMRESKKRLQEGYDED
jgi:hypothetical protein